ncbi:uncharacterized protein LOC131951952 [Physella acuta]|uniref:uncharacterized protein LOC131951952 n=1 Tax=Physella acuta TaxID=109671 RepID=UPI0027DB581B|nr:uncharacterized protein LOC131951952 [Physella acuta]XP_059170405.1 uncharacterized protein LOC131951952 [Physella acuta]
MAYHPYMYQRSADFQGQSTHPSQFLPSRVTPFSFPIGAPFSINAGAAHTAGVAAYCQNPGALNTLPSFLLADYMSHPEYYRTLRAAAGFEPKDDGREGQP